MYVVLLDASQAFDRVHYVKLFKLLIDRGICPLLARLLAKMYTEQSLRVKWNSQFSNSFKVSNGVKQGAILSPLLFSVYMDELLQRLSRANIGCHIGNKFCGALGYADDVSLLAPSRNAINEMLAICEEFGKDYNVKFNAEKSQLILYNTAVQPAPIHLNKNVIPIRDHAVHLGHVIGSDSNALSIDNAIKDLYYRTNAVMAKFGFCNSTVRSHMFTTYCTSFYGCTLWKFDDNYIDRFYTAWRKCVRKVWKVPPTTHGYILSHLCQKPCISAQLLSRSLSFYYNAVNSTNKYVSLCAQLCNYSKTAMAGNLRLLCNKLNVAPDFFKQHRVSVLKRRLIRNSSAYHKECDAAGGVARELCLMRDGEYETIYDSVTLDAFLFDICTK